MSQPCWQLLTRTEDRNEVPAAMPPMRHAPSCDCRMTALQRGVNSIADRVGTGALAEMANRTASSIVGEVLHADLHYSPKNVGQSGRLIDPHRTGG